MSTEKGSDTNLAPGRDRTHKDQSLSVVSHSSSRGTSSRTQRQTLKTQKSSVRAEEPDLDSIQPSDDEDSRTVSSGSENVHDDDCRHSRHSHKSAGHPMKSSELTKLTTVLSLLSKYDGTGDWEAFYDSFSADIMSRRHLSLAQQHKILQDHVIGDARCCVATSKDHSAAIKATFANLKTAFGHNLTKDKLLQDFNKLSFHQSDPDKMRQDMATFANARMLLLEQGVAADDDRVTKVFASKLPHTLRKGVLKLMQLRPQTTIDDAIIKASGDIRYMELEQEVNDLATSSSSNEIPKTALVKYANDSYGEPKHGKPVYDASSVTTRFTDHVTKTCLPGHYAPGRGLDIESLPITFPFDNNEPLTCPVCSEAGHSALRFNLNSADFRDQVEQKKLCPLCLSQSHAIENCTSTRSCIYCGGMHHTGGCPLKEFYRDLTNYPQEAKPRQTLFREAKQDHSVKVTRAASRQKESYSNFVSRPVPHQISITRHGADPNSRLSFICPTTVDSKTLLALVDTGVSLSLISESRARKLGLEVLQQTQLAIQEFCSPTVSPAYTHAPKLKSGEGSPPLASMTQNLMVTLQRGNNQVPRYAKSTVVQLLRTFRFLKNKSWQSEYIQKFTQSECPIYQQSVAGWIIIREHYAEFDSRGLSFPGKLKLRLDTDDLWRVVRNLRSPVLPCETSEPLYIHSNHPLAELLIRDRNADGSIGKVYALIYICLVIRGTFNFGGKIVNQEIASIEPSCSLTAFSSQDLRLLIVNVHCIKLSEHGVLSETPLEFDRNLVSTYTKTTVREHLEQLYAAEEQMWKIWSLAYVTQLRESTHADERCFLDSAVKYPPEPFPSKAMPNIPEAPTNAHKASHTQDAGSADSTARLDSIGERGEGAAKHLEFPDEQISIDPVYLNPNISIPDYERAGLPPGRARDYLPLCKSVNLVTHHYSYYFNTIRPPAIPGRLTGLIGLSETANGCSHRDH
ncbi:hypothetical protein L5515_006745 [Caenorhabditis briggsae]|uniref:Peptidase A2 domain-containing protein n=1 Tax=Caenorhabditis briggsae TaxID=6238 RepID=A0AAE9JKC3_CAEBR|nr:hypothetical protein L5515_006745 [Caenorhabditis briggsae]